MTTFDPGDSVTVTGGPMKGLLGTVIGYYDSQGKYLVRFGAQQQLYYREDEIVAWSSRDSQA